MVFSGVCLYYLYQVLLQWIHSGYTDEISEIANLESLPMSNVTVCAQVYANETFIRHNITIPLYVLSKLRNGTDGSVLDEFYRLLTIYLSPITRPRFDQTFMTDFAKVVRANPQLHDYAGFVLATAPTCRTMFKRCWFDGEEFDCCTKAVPSIDDDGICYLFHLNFDSDNAYPSPGTLPQSRPGPAGGFSVEVSLPISDFPWLDDDATNGFRVMVGHVPYTFLQSVLTVPDRSETFIKVTPSKRVLSTNCASRGHMSMPGGAYAYYDPEGLSCILRGFKEVTQKYIGCEFEGYLDRPNITASCSVAQIYIITTFLFAPDIATRILLSDGKTIGITADSGARFVHKGEQDTRSHKYGRCPTHCQYWTYDSKPSFAYLDNPNEDGKVNNMYSKIHVYYAELGYRQHEQVKETTVYMAFCDFANVVGLYWGMSIISFFHVFFYVPRYGFVLWRHRHPRVVPQ